MLIETDAALKILFLETLASNKVLNTLLRIQGCNKTRITLHLHVLYNVYMNIIIRIYLHMCVIVICVLLSYVCYCCK